MGGQINKSRLIVADATVATTRPPNEPANKNDIITRRAVSRVASAYLLRSNLYLMMRKLNATAIPITMYSISRYARLGFVVA